MAYQKKETTSYGGRLKGSLGGAKSGALLFALGTVLLFLNEGNYVKTNKSIGEAGAALVRVSDVSTLDPSLDGKLIHAYAFADTQDVLTDSLFDVSERAIALERSVAYYQWQEHTSTQTKDNIGGGQETETIYTYRQAWVPGPINSGAFAVDDYKNSNFVLAQIESRAEAAANVSFGAYKLPPFIIQSIRGSAPVNVTLSEESLMRWEEAVSNNMAALGMAPPDG